MTTVPIPTHLRGHVIASESEDGRRFELRSSAGGSRFEIRYYGEIFADYGLIVGVDAPSLVVARAVDTGEDVVLFDGGRHGYNAMFVEAYDPAELDVRLADHLFERDGESAFEVEVEVYDNIDWDDEEDDFRDKSGVLRLITGEEIDSERLRADGFDVLGVAITTAGGERIDIVEEELA